MKVSIKEVFESDGWIITAIHQGYSGMVRVDAKRRFPKPDHSSFMSEWCTEKYANILAKENYNKKVNKFSCYKY